MIYPSIDDLLTRVDSRYSLVILAAKRARQLREMQSNLEEGLTLKEVSTALDEISKGQVTFERTKDGIK